MIGVYGEKVRRELQIVKEIRNEFAHKLETKSFEATRVKSLADNLRFIKTKIWQINHPEDEKIDVQLFPKTQPVGARERFIATCQLLIGLFGVIEPPELPDPEF